ncbi:disease resistance protein At4g27190-like [Abrus precatorius]|uniref:Disease resistance protein At4g27190-like n=1 Tax=Abrus precatorius TaxID=3816 RepID=A0A8B8KE37_ABRPR|nr:disease resistance protein At4g27190-like [Abrus precatorius]
MDFGTSVGTEIVKDLIYAVTRQDRYSVCFSSFVEDVGKEKQMLTLTRKSVLDKADKAKKRTEKIADDVEQWLNNADILLEEVEILEKKAETKKSCFLGHCPNWIWRYRLGKEAAKKKLTIRKLNTNIQNQILNALKDDEVRMIGVYGMGGIGKTALVKEVGKEAEQIFDKVVFLPVSSALDVRKIQGNIASALDFELKEEDISVRAKRLYLRLTSGQNILIILDDVWQMLDFEAIGIPFGENYRGCNILLTTRSLHVCTMMHCQRIIPLTLITEEEAWAMFQKHAHIMDKASEALKGLAQEITNQCKGLPVAIKAVASTLKGKKMVEWVEALETLRESKPLDIEPGLENPYKCLQLSYDNLKNEEAKSLFLLCSLFPEDSEIPLEILIRFGFGLGLFEDVNSFERARTKVTATINKLLNSGLLLQAEERPAVIMNDLVCDVALWIAKKEIHVIMDPKMDTKTLKEDTDIKGTIKFLYCYNINEFPDQLDCPNLEILYMYKDSEGSFKVLVLHYHRILKGIPSLLLAQSIPCLTNLRTLCLRGCRLDDLSFLGKLEKLETLEFYNCMINELSNDIAELKKLRLLDVSLCSIEGNPYDVLGRCSQLEELYFIKNDLPERVLNDQNLVKFFHKSSSLYRFQRYHLDIGSSDYKFKGDMRSKLLSVDHFDVSTSSAAIKDLVQRAEILFLRNIKGSCKNFIPNIAQIEGRSTNELIELHLDRSDEMECLIDTSNLFCVGIVFSNLVKLRVTWMKHLKALFHGPPPPGLFEKLEELRIAQCSQLRSISSLEKLNMQCLKVLKFENCPMLTSLFSPAVIQSLGQLEVLNIRRCDGLKHIMTDEDAEIVLDDNGQQSYRLMFTKLKHLVVKWCEKLESLIPVTFSKGLKQLECLEIDKAPELKYVFHQDQLSCQNQNELHVIEFPVLKLLKLLHLPNIINICPESYHPMLPCLQNLYLQQCPQLNVMSVSHSIFGSMRQEGDTKWWLEIPIFKTYGPKAVATCSFPRDFTAPVVGDFKM